MSVGSLAAPAGGASVAPASAASPSAGVRPRTVTLVDSPIEPFEAAPVDALAAMLSEAAARQDSLAPLLANLEAALEAPALPEDARATAAQLLAAQVPLDADVTGEALRGAALSSGVFLEQALAQLAPDEADPRLGGDLKALLLRLVADLRTAGGEAGRQPPAAQPGAQRPQPPVSGQTAGQPAARPTIDPQAPAETLSRVLAQQAGAALARVQLSQAASLQEPGGPVHWTFELPVATPDGAAIAQFEISRDGRGQGAAGGPAPVWRARFSVDAAPSGPVHAELAVTAQSTRVTLVAEDAAAAASLGADQDQLAAALAGEQGGDVAVRVRAGAPPRPPQPPPGRFVDRQS
ncbi:MAG TPA: flagellar hook-length control protein FliK [Caulobacteraceae bacterium]|jgi:hypothetical protein